MKIVTIKDIYEEVLYTIEIPKDKEAKVAIEQLVKEGKSLDYADLSDYNLRRAILNEAKLYGASLKRADLFRASLKDADLQEVDMRDSKLVEADLEHALLCDADLSGSCVKDTKMLFTDLRGCNTKETKLYKANISGANFEGNCIKSGVILKEDGYLGFTSPIKLNTYNTYKGLYIKYKNNIVSEEKFLDIIKDHPVEKAYLSMIKTAKYKFGI